jgi:Zn-dependent protease
VAFSLALTGGGVNLFYDGERGAFDPAVALYLLLISMVTVGSGFVLHELSHKFVARRYGYWAEFRMWPLGLVLALATSVVGFIFAAPGATYISGTNITGSQNGKISLAGPLTNIAVAGVFLPMYFLPGLPNLLGLIGVRINIFLAFFNMLPIGPLDGSKVFRWNTFFWVLAFVPLVVGLYFSYTAIV